MSLSAIDPSNDTQNNKQKTNNSCPTTMLSISLVNGNGYKFFFVATFNLQISMHIQNFPFFFGPITIGENHVTSFINYIKLVVNN
jgi:hypothetical protein